MLRDLRDAGFGRPSRWREQIELLLCMAHLQRVSSKMVICHLFSMPYMDIVLAKHVTSRVTLSCSIIVAWHCYYLIHKEKVDWLQVANIIVIIEDRDYKRYMRLEISFETPIMFI